VAEAEGRRARRKGRRWAMKALFMWDARGDGEADLLVDDAQRMELAGGVDVEGAAADRAQARSFAQRIVAGAIAHRDVIDPVLESVAARWSVGRMAAVDRAILRVATYELLYDDTPEAVAVSEAVELAKQYSTAESPGFVNGLLGAIAPRRAGADGAEAGKGRRPSRPPARPAGDPPRRRSEKA